MPKVLTVGERHPVQIGGQFSFAQIRAEEPETICAFVGDSDDVHEGEAAAVLGKKRPHLLSLGRGPVSHGAVSLFGSVVSKSGKCYKYAHDPEAGGDSKRLESCILFNNTSE
ncbi:hypothetical protein [Mollivirus kamchatka]|nr:hypothetical protein [Mollivirus kamchatka]